MLRQSSIAALMMVGPFVVSSQAVDDVRMPAGPPPREGRIYNLDSRPFQFRLARKTGRTWTDEITLSPGDVFTIRPGAPEDVNALEGITGDGNGHVTIEFPELGGRIRLLLPAIDENKKAYVPNWFHVRDSNGFSRMIQAANRDDAEMRHKQLLAEPPLAEAELARIKQMLRANFVLYDK